MKIWEIPRSYIATIIDKLAINKHNPDSTFSVSRQNPEVTEMEF